MPANIRKCFDHPPLGELYIENEFWQVLETSNGTFKMFNAYYDNREASKVGPVIRILAYINQPFIEVKTFCQFKFTGSRDPIVVETHEYRLMWYTQWGINSKGSQPHLISCINPFASFGLVPLTVSLVEHECDEASNSLEIIYNEPEIGKKKPFGVCVKHLDFMDDQSALITEWIETLALLGAHKIFIYVIKLHSNMMRTLKFYETMGRVKVEMIAEPAGLPKRKDNLQQWLQNEMISLNDCLYKHMYEYEYLSPLDIDEIILPTKPKDKTWSDLLARVTEKGKLPRKDAYVARNVFFLSDNNHEGEIQPEVPSDMTFLQHIYRAQNYSRIVVGAKSFHNTETVVVIHNHFPMQCFNKEYCVWQSIPVEDAHLQHYRRDCENYPKDECQGFKDHTVKDLTLWKYKDELIKNFKKSMNAQITFDEPGK